MDATDCQEPLPGTIRTTVKDKAGNYRGPYRYVIGSHTPRLDHHGRCCGASLSIERLDLDDRGTVIAADPEGHRPGRIVDPHAPHICVLPQLILCRPPCLWVTPHHAVVRHAGGPQLP